MTTTDDIRPTLAERHAVDLAGRRSDANTVIAAGFASSRSVRMTLGLTLFRAAEDCRDGATQIQHRARADDVVRLVRDAIVNQIHLDRQFEPVWKDCGPLIERHVDWHRGAVYANLVREFDALPRQQQDCFRTVHALVLAQVIDGNAEASKLCAIRAIYDSSSPPAPRQRVLPGELLALHDWSLPMLLYRSGHSGRQKLFPATASEIVESVIKWWLTDVCPVCHGRRYELQPGSQIVSDVICQECNGIGKPPVEHRLQSKRREAGRWLASEYDGMVSAALGAMSQALAHSFDIDLSQQPALQQRLTELRSDVANLD